MESYIAKNHAVYTADLQLLPFAGLAALITETGNACNILAENPSESSPL